MSHFDLENREIPPEGISVKGEIADDIFQLSEDDAAKPVGPVKFDLRAYQIEGELVVQGEFSADFELECARCLEGFAFSVKLEAHGLAENLENPSDADLTEALREDILLALPAYPRCEEGKVPRRCPAEGKFESVENAPDGAGSEGSEPAEDEPNPWAELDKLPSKESDEQPSE